MFNKRCYSSEGYLSLLALRNDLPWGPILSNGIKPSHEYFLTHNVGRWTGKVGDNLPRSRCGRSLSARFRHARFAKKNIYKIEERAVLPHTFPLRVHSFLSDEKRWWSMAFPRSENLFHITHSNTCLLFLIIFRDLSLASIFTTESMTLTPSCTLNQTTDLVYQPWIVSGLSKALYFEKSPSLFATL